MVDLWGGHLPSVALAEIFRHVVESEGSLPFLCRVATVSKLWNDVSKSASLWREIDMSMDCVRKEEKTLLDLVNGKNLTQTRVLDLSKWPCLTDSGIKIISDNCPQLNWIKFSESTGSCDGLALLFKKCPHIMGLSLSSMKMDFDKDNSLLPIISNYGANLKDLNFSLNVFRNSDDILDLIGNTCHQLEVLDMTDAKFIPSVVKFDIESMQRNCTRLRILRLRNLPLQTCHVSCEEQAANPGFLELLELDIGMNLQNHAYSEDDSSSSSTIERLLKTSYGLKSLDISGCEDVTVENLHNIVATDLQSLLMSNSSVAKYEGIDVLLTKWKHSLIVLDLSHNHMPGMSLEMAMKKLGDVPRLQKLDLRGTKISCLRVKSILEGCPLLRTLNLEYCEDLPQGMSKEYSDLDLLNVRGEIDSFTSG